MFTSTFCCNSCKLKAQICFGYEFSNGGNIILGGKAETAKPECIGLLYNMSQHSLNYPRFNPSSPLADVIDYAIHSYLAVFPFASLVLIPFQTYIKFEL